MPDAPDTPEQAQERSDITAAMWPMQAASIASRDNPFHGRYRVIFAVDEWAHRHGLVMVNHKPYGLWRRPWLLPFTWICNWWDGCLCVGDFYEEDVPVEDIIAAWNDPSAIHGVTAPPS